MGDEQILKDLDSVFGKGDSIRFVDRGRVGGSALLRHSDGTCVEVMLYGAQIMSFIPPSANEVLFVSSKPLYENGKPVRGGMPICWPQFGSQGPLPAHGFARTRPWEVESASVLPNGAARLVLVLKADEETRKLWPHNFELRHMITCGKKLESLIEVKNICTKPFDFQIVLHTYYALKNVAGAVVSGLSGCEYIDTTVQERPTRKQHAAELSIDRFIDSIYCQTPDVLTLGDLAAGRTVTINKKGFPDAVVWNPWSDKSATFKDLGAEDYRQFVCVESGVIAKAITLVSGQAWRGEQTITHV